MWGFLQFLLDYWAKITGGIVGTVGVVTAYVTLGGPYPVSQHHVDAKIIAVKAEMLAQTSSLRSPLRAVQINQIEGQISRLEAEQDQLASEKSQRLVDLPKMTDAIARGLVEQRLRDIDTRLKRIAKDILRLEQEVAALRSTNANAPIP